MYFIHSEEVWVQFPQLRALTMVVRGVAGADSSGADTSDVLGEVGRVLDNTPESELPPIQAWRQGYAAMGLKPTQYRCAAEALLRRFRKERNLPQLHPLVDMLNAESMRAATPVAAFDIAHVVQGITVRPARGDEVYTTFQGETERPTEGEIIFADSAGQAHSRRWVYRQGAVSAVRDTSDAVLIVAEALHDGAEPELATLEGRIRARVEAFGIPVTEAALLTPNAREFNFLPVT